MDGMFPSMSDKPVNQKSFSRSGRSRQKYIVPHRQYVESFILSHLILDMDYFMDKFRIFCHGETRKIFWILDSFLYDLANQLSSVNLHAMSDEFQSWFDLTYKIDTNSQFIELSPIDQI